MWTSAAMLTCITKPTVPISFLGPLRKAPPREHLSQRMNGKGYPATPTDAEKAGRKLLTASAGDMLPMPQGSTTARAGLLPTAHAVKQHVSVLGLNASNQRTTDTTGMKGTTTRTVSITSTMSTRMASIIIIITTIIPTMVANPTMRVMNHLEDTREENPEDLENPEELQKNLEEGASQQGGRQEDKLALEHHLRLRRLLQAQRTPRVKRQRSRSRKGDRVIMTVSQILMMRRKKRRRVSE